MSTPHPPPARKSAWSAKQKLVRLLWATIARALWRILPPARPALLRFFGGRCGANCRLSGSCEITIPWNITLGDDVVVGDRVILYALGPIAVGDRTVLDYQAHLCAGTHDMRDSRFPLLRPPITIGPDCFVGIDAYVGPDIELGPNTHVCARASVYKGHAGNVRLSGNPARELEDDA